MSIIRGGQRNGHIAIKLAVRLALVDFGGHYLPETWQGRQDSPTRAMRLFFKDNLFSFSKTYPGLYPLFVA